MYNDQLVYKVFIWAFFGINLWTEKVALNKFILFIFSSTTEADQIIFLILKITKDRLPTHPFPKLPTFLFGALFLIYKSNQLAVCGICGGYFTHKNWG